jgi:acylphosphatase
MAEKPIRVVRVRIRGRVQGVSYRAWTAEAAEVLNLTGWVRNRADGSVEALFAGDPDEVAEMLERCREGPYGARVREVMIEEGVEAPDRFDIRPTL